MKYKVTFEIEVDDNKINEIYEWNKKFSSKVTLEDTSNSFKGDIEDHIYSGFEDESCYDISNINIEKL